MLFELGLCLLLGFLVKIADSQVDERIFRSFADAPYLVAIAYGVAGGFLLSSDVPYATVGLALVAGMLFAGKVDHKVHQTGVAVALLVATARGWSTVAWMPFAALLVASVGDEVFSDMADAGKFQSKFLASVAKMRLFADLTAVIVTLVMGIPEFAFAVILFDAGYHAASALAFRYEPSIMRGNHLIVDLFDCRRSVLQSEAAVRRFLDATPEKIGMTKIAGPFVVRFEPKDVKKRREWGISGIVIIAESHISAHTYPYTGSAKVDIYSCKDFDRNKAEKLVTRFFGSKNYSSKFLLRAVDEHLALAGKGQAREILEKER
jgi:S-adenosylmethionine decarboxylase